MERNSYPFNNDQAVKLFDDGCILILLDVPLNTEIGIDYNSWQTGEKFKGIKMIPPGFHFIHYSSVDKDGQVSPRTSIMHFFKEKEILIKTWDRSIEDFVDESNPEVLGRFEGNKRDLDKFLGAYPYDNHRKWISLTNFITKDILIRMNPESGRIMSVAQFESLPSTTESRKKAEADKQACIKKVKHDISEDPLSNKLPDMYVIPGTELRFSDIPKSNVSVGSLPSDITKNNMDQSFKVKILIESTQSVENILGELQMCFVCFLIGQVYEAFEQWKKLVSVMCECVDAINEYPDLYFKFINVLHYHIREIPEDFFVDIVSKDNFLCRTLTKFFENLDVSMSRYDLKQKGIRFRKNLEKRFNFSFDCESGEYAPVVVE